MGGGNTEQETTLIMAKRQLTAIPANRSARSRRIREWTVVGAWIALALMGPLALLVAVRNTSAPAPVISGSTYPTRVVSFSEIVAGDFLAGRSTRMPVVEDVDPGFGFPNGEGTVVPYETLTVLSASSTQVPQGPSGALRTLDVVTFRAQLEDGRVMDLSVTSTPDQRGFPLLAAAPSLRKALLGANESVDAVDYQGVPGAELPSAAVTTAVEQWATAFVGDDREQLRVIVNGASAGNPPNGEYVGLGGFTISRAVQVGEIVPSSVEGGFTYARVELPVVETATGAQATFAYDVLIARSSGNDPRVVGWGAPGTGSLLVPFANNTGFGG